MNKQNSALQTYLINLTEQYRQELHYTQERMAEQLHITARAYNNIKQGRHALSASTFLFLLLSMPDTKATQVLHELKVLLQTADEDVTTVS